jgi:hypothetical protein
MKYTKFLTMATILLAVLLLTFVGCDKRTFEPDSFVIKELVAPDSLYSGVEATIEALVVDKEDVPVSGETVTFKTERGVIQAKVVTDDFGIATATFSHNVLTADPVSTTIEAYIHKSTVTKTIWLRKHPGDYTIFRLTATPSIIYADNNVTTSEIRATIKDKDGFGAPNQTVRFSSNYGQITTMVVTDDAGIATATFGDNGDLPDADNPLVIRATIDQHEAILTAPDIVIEPVSDDYELTLTVDPSVIYADNNITYATVKAQVRDSDGYPVVEESVQFGSNIGSVISQVMTDNTGIATTTFWDAGQMGTATIFARIGNTEKTVEVSILETPEVASIVLDVQEEYLLEQIVTIRAYAENVNGDPVSDGTLVVFTATNGGFGEETMESSAQANTSRGYAQVTFNTGTNAGTLEVTATIGAVSTTEQSYIFPGPPAFVSLRTEKKDAGEDEFSPVPPGGLPVNYHGEVRVRASVKDLFNNSVSAGNALIFETTLGAIQEIAATNDQGIAYAEYFAGVSSGTAQITATAVLPSEDEPAIGTTVLNFYSTDVQAIVFVDQEEVYLNVQGVGGLESATLMVNLRDYNGNLVTGQHEVMFEIVHQPPAVPGDPDYMPVNINNAGDSDTVLSNNGVAVASLNSGTVSGTVGVRASLVNNPVISATKTNIVVTGGPPHTVVPFIGQFDTGVSLGGGLWLIQAGAFVSDVYGNPVIDGTTVAFSLSTNPVPPPHTSIFGGGVVGNPSLDDEEGTAGVAYTTLIYHGLYTYKPIEIFAESGGVNGNSTEHNDDVYLRLPIQQPRMEMQVDPGYHEYFPSTIPVNQTSRIDVSLQDGQGNDINGAVILLTSSHGQFDLFVDDWPHNDGLPPSKIRTYQGMAKGQIRSRGWECPEPVDEWFTTIDIQINSFLQGTNTLAQTTLTVRRYRDDHARSIFELME